MWRIVQDHVKKELMFLGTEFGLFFTVDGGKKWIELTGGVPTISFRDVVIQRRENDLVAGSFGRGIFILDDYTPLRGMTAEQLQSDALLFPARTAPWYIPNSLHSDSQGDDQFVAKNPEFGATFTYYLKDSLMTATGMRQEKDKELVKDGKGTVYPNWETAESELREAKPAVYLTVKDQNGNVVRHVKGLVKKGIHRVTWDLHYPSQFALNGVDDDQDSDEDQGILAAPGTYTATLFSRVNGVTKQLADPVNFDVEVMRKGALKGSTPEKAVEFSRKASNVMRSISAANAVIQEQKKKMTLYRKAMDLSLAADSSLDQQWHAMRAELFELEEALTGKKSREQRGSAPATIYSRASRLLWVSSTYGPTKTDKEQLGYAVAEYAKVKKRLDIFIQKTVPAFQKALDVNSAPWTPGAPVPAIQ